jgi:tetratricopeptide (TPR) repeat protein
MALAIASCFISLPTAAQGKGSAEASTQLAKGHAAYLAGNAEAALAAYEQAKAASPDVPSIHFYLACALARQGREDEAVVALQTAISLDAGKNPTFANRLGLFRGQLEERRQKWAAAATAYGEVVTRGGQPLQVVAAAKTRAEVLSARDRLAESYAPVRQRLADTQFRSLE